MPKELLSIERLLTPDVSALWPTVIQDNAEWEDVIAPVLRTLPMVMMATSEDIDERINYLCSVVQAIYTKGWQKGQRDAHQERDFGGR